MWLGDAADRRRIGDPPGAPRERGCPAWVVLGVKAVEARGAVHGEKHPHVTRRPTLPFIGR